ncbi:MAG: hypothetical protein H0T46_12710 [Deltaproteobacteria bacterium]|nr:hypothetical protein [Deltaproteobacteria bacterium]
MFLLGACRAAPIELGAPVPFQLGINDFMIGIDMEIRVPVSLEQEHMSPPDETWFGKPFDVVVTTDPRSLELYSFEAPCGLRTPNTQGRDVVLARTDTPNGVQVTCERHYADGTVVLVEVSRLERNMDAVILCRIRLGKAPSDHEVKAAEAVCASLTVKGRSAYDDERKPKRPADAAP